MKSSIPITRQTKGLRSAFTLIELLVVIAIIAILASILFPVFGRARENARRASCQSNMKQMAIGISQYTQDYDEKVPRYTNGQAYATGLGFTWVRAILPYTKSYGIGRCPSQTEDPFGVWSGSQPSGYTQQFIVSYGINYNYLNAPQPPCSVVNGDYNWTPINIAKIQQPTATVLFVETGIFGNATDGFYINSTQAAEAPGVYLGDPDECQYGNTGWGEGNYLDSGTYKPKSYTGNVESRHFGGTNVAFVDGHVKWMTPGRLAEGTNWRVGITNTAVNITDLSRYIWDYR